MSTAALNNLLTYILSLGLSDRNRKWLAEHIMNPEAKVMTDTDYIESSPEMMRILEQGRKEISEGRGTAVTVEELWK